MLKHRHQLTIEGDKLLRQAGCQLYDEDRLVERHALREELLPDNIQPEASDEDMALMRFLVTDALRELSEDISQRTATRTGRITIRARDTMIARLSCQTYAEIAQELGGTTHTVRRDVERVAAILIPRLRDEDLWLCGHGAISRKQMGWLLRIVFGSYVLSLSGWDE